MPKPIVIYHPSIETKLTLTPENNSSKGVHNMVRGGIAGAVITGATLSAGPANASDSETVFGISDVQLTDDNPEITINRIDDELDLENTDYSSHTTQSIIGGIGEIIRPGDVVEDDSSNLIQIYTTNDYETPALETPSEQLVSPEPIIRSVEPAPVESTRPSAPTETATVNPEPSENLHQESAELNHEQQLELVINSMNTNLAEINIETLDAPYEISNIMQSAVLMHEFISPTDETVPENLPEGVIKLYPASHASGLRVPFTIAERTANVELLGTRNMVAAMYASAEIYQQLVEKEYPQYTGSMLRIRDLMSPHHRTHDTDDADISSAMGPTVDWYSDGPGMDKTSENYDEEFTIRFLELISHLHINGERVIRIAVFEDPEVVSRLESSADATYGGTAPWHVDHVHLEGMRSNIFYKPDANTIPWTHDQDLRIGSEGIPISDEQRLLEHSKLLDFIASGSFPVGSVRSQLHQNDEQDIDAVVITSGHDEPAQTIENDENSEITEINEVTIDGLNMVGGLIPPIYGEGIVPDISDVGEPDESGYMNEITAGNLPDPYSYQYFENGEAVSLLRAMEISQEFQERGYDHSWGETQMVRLTPKQYITLFRLAGFPEYDIPNLIGMTNGESMYYTQIVGDRTIGGAVGAGQQLERWLTDPENRTFSDMFDPWQNILETRDKYLDNWRRNGFENRLVSWNAVNNNISGYQAGVEEALNILNSTQN